MAKMVTQKPCGTGSKEMTGVWLRAEEEELRGQGPGQRWRSGASDTFVSQEK